MSKIQFIPFQKRIPALSTPELKQILYTFQCIDCRIIEKCENCPMYAPDTENKSYSGLTPCALGLVRMEYKKRLAASEERFNLYR